MVLWAPHAVTILGLRPVVNATTSSDTKTEAEKKRIYLRAQ